MDRSESGVLAFALEAAFSKTKVFRAGVMMPVFCIFLTVANVFFSFPQKCSKIGETLNNKNLGS